MNLLELNKCSSRHSQYKILLFYPFDSIRKVIKNGFLVVNYFSRAFFYNIDGDCISLFSHFKKQSNRFGY